MDRLLYKIEEDIVSTIRKYGVSVGELQPETMARTTMNPETRVIERVVVEDVERMAQQFEKWFSNEVTDRKQYIEENLHKYVRDLD